MIAILLFPLAAVLCSFWAFFLPDLFTPLQPAIIPLLGVVMFGMGMSIAMEDFLAVVKQPFPLLLGLLMQFTIMPCLAYLLAQIFQLPGELLIGFVLLGACPGGTASNVICYLAKGDVALSILLTTISTILAVVLTPWITWGLLGQVVEVPWWKMMKMIFQVILLPVVAGMLLNRLLNQRLRPVQEFMPVLSMIAIVLIISIIVALNHQLMAELALIVVVVVLLHNVSGLLLAYSAAKALGYSEKVCKTLAIEVGMQNSGLAVALASQFFSPLSALPGALFSIWHNISGAFFASFSQRQLIHKQ